jgi:hypothetical protein
MTAPIRTPNFPLGTSIGEFIGHQIEGTTRSTRRFTANNVLGTFAALQVGGGVVFTTKASADSHLAYAAFQMALVTSDATPANNGIYQKQGASGSGAWTRVADLPNEVIAFTVTGGTGDAITATMTPQVPTTPATKLYLMTPTANNTGAVTINGVAVKNSLGSTLVANSLIDGCPVLMIWQLDHYQLLVSVALDTAGVVADATAARDDAEGFKDGAEAAQTAAEAAASALDNQVHQYDTRALERFSVDVNRNSKGVPKGAQIRFGLL